MSTIFHNIKNPYKTKKSFLADPFASLYQTPDKEVSRNESIENLIHYASSLEECIPGDFDLQTIVTEIKSQILSFVRTGLLAYKVKFLKLYRKAHKNFKTFCEKALGVSHWQINRKIEAARVVIELAQSGFSVLPTCEAQARPLTKLYGVELCDKWKKVVESLEPHTITSNRINEVLGVENKTANLRLSKKLYELIKRKALEMGLTIEQLLNMLFEADQEVSPVKEENLAKWEEDLESLINQETEEIQAHDKSVPIGTLFEQSNENNKEENSSLLLDSKKEGLKTNNKTKTSKNKNLKYDNSTDTNLVSSSSLQSSTQNNYIPRTKKSKRKKPLLEILDIDKENRLKKRKHLKTNHSSNEIHLDINQFKKDGF